MFEIKLMNQKNFIERGSFRFIKALSITFIPIFSKTMSTKAELPLFAHDPSYTRETSSFVHLLP